MPIVIRKKPTAPAKSHGAATTNDEHRTPRRKQPAENESIARATAAAILGITDRTLLNWNRLNFGPKRFRISLGRYRYKRSECEAWVAKHGKGRRQPRKRRGSSGSET